MRQTLADLKTILNDSEERFEFIGGFICCLLFLIGMFVFLSIFA